MMSPATKETLLVSVMITLFLGGIIMGAVGLFMTMPVYRALEVIGLLFFIVGLIALCSWASEDK